MKLMLTVSGPGPLWTSRSPGRGNPRYKPDPAEYADFATRGREPLRRPTSTATSSGTSRTCRRGCARRRAASRRRCTPVAPHLYRGLVRAAYPAIKAADPGAEVLIGAMSSRGARPEGANSTLRPLAFLRALGCVDARFTRLRTGRCKGFKPATGGRLRVPPARRR